MFVQFTNVVGSGEMFVDDDKNYCKALMCFDNNDGKIERQQWGRHLDMFILVKREETLKYKFQISLIGKFNLNFSI